MTNSPLSQQMQASGKEAEEIAYSNIFKTVKQAVTTRQVAEHLGLAIDEKGMSCCPFHGGNAPNMRISDRYYCFDCRASGDVIDFVAVYLSVDKLEAAKLMRYSIQGWKVGPQHRFPIYGQQRSWIRDEDCKQERKRDHPNPEKEQSMLEQDFVPVTDTSDVPFPEAHEE